LDETIDGQIRECTDIMQNITVSR